MAADDDASAVTIRPLTDADWDALLEVDLVTFHSTGDPEEADASREVLDLTLFHGAEADGRLVGIAGWYDVEMSLPGGRTPVAGVTWVSVLPTHRRRGILRGLMTTQLADLHERGRPVAALYASEPAIYGRFGYGLATSRLRMDVPRGSGAVLPTAPTDPALRLRFADVADVALTEPVYEEVARRRPGMLLRGTDAWRRQAVLDLASRRDGATPLRAVVVEDDQRVRGYARYNVKGDWTDAGPDGTVRVREVLATDPAAYAALLRFLTDIDLTARVRIWNLPEDDAALHLLAEPRRAQPGLTDAVFVRLVDLGPAMEARGYAAPVDAVVGVTDRTCPWNAGRWRLTAKGTGSPGDASFTRTDAAADVDLDVADLGAAYLGGTTLASLAAAGRVTGDEEAVAALSRAMRWDLAPWNASIF